MGQFLNLLLAQKCFHVVRYQNLIVCLLFFEGLYSRGAEVNNGLFISPGLCFGKMARGFRAEDESVIHISVLSKDL